MDFQNQEIRLYESSLFAAIGDGLRRPGGLEITETAITAAGLNPGDQILDLGCGSGDAVAFLIAKKGLAAQGIDSSQSLLAEGKSRFPNLPLILGDVMDLPFADNQFDAMLAECVLSLISEKSVVLSQIRRCLKPTGRLLVSDVYFKQDDTIQEGLNLPFSTCLNGLQTQEKFTNILCQNGFILDQFTDYSNLYKNYIAQLIMTYGSTGLFWQQFCGACTQRAKQAEAAVKGRKIGYFLAVAKML
ncbi:MAG: methyltransferase domain-containing protein [Clostridiales bacterium]